MATTLTQRWIKPSCVQASWNLAASEAGDPFEFPQFGDKTVTITGTLAGVATTLQGSNDGTNWFTIKDFLGVAIAPTAAAMATLGESPRYIRPLAGVGQTVTVILVARGGAR